MEPHAVRLKAARMVEMRRRRIFVEFITQVYWIMEARLRESIDLLYLGKLSNNNH
jgi:hypothetical protein